MADGRQANKDVTPRGLGAAPARLPVLFVTTSMPVGGAETLLAALLRRLDRRRFAPALCCLKSPGPLAAACGPETPVSSRLLEGKYDVRVLPRLIRLIQRLGRPVVITVGAGDKMFWGRIAGRLGGARAVLCALHSTGWPDAVGRLNRLLTPLTDAFIAVADRHARHLIRSEGFPPARVRVVRNGVDTQRFQGGAARRAAARRLLGLAPNALVCGTVAALRPEKDLTRFVEAAALVRRELPGVQFVIIGEGPERPRIEQAARAAGLHGALRLLGRRTDVADLLPALDLFVLTSLNEAAPVSILEAMACELPVAATNVGSVPELVTPGRTGLLAPPGDAAAMAACWRRLLGEPPAARRMGRQGRMIVERRWSLQAMVAGYEQLILEAARRRKAFAPARRPSRISEPRGAVAPERGAIR